jgi:tetratricopeptide (TPR) repeat protein
MPLAIELAAGWVPVLSLPDIEAEITKGFGFLEGKLQDVEERHQSLQAVAGGSWSMLTEDEKSVFKKMSIIKGPFTRKAAQNIAGAEINDLLSLSNKSFMQKDSEGFLQIHEWLRQFGESELRKSNAVYSETLEIFSHYYVTYLSESWWEAWSGECQHLRLEWRNIMEAFLMTARVGDFQLLRKGLVPFFFVSYIGEDFNESTIFFGQMSTEFTKRDLDENERQIFTLCLAFHSYFLMMQNKYAQVVDIYGKVEDLLRECDQGLEYAWIRILQSLDDTYLDRERRVENAQQALKIFIKLHDEYAVAFTCNFLGAWCYYGDTKREYCQRALAIARKHHGTRDIAWALVGLGYSKITHGDFEQATELLTEAHSHFANIGYKYGIIDSFGYLGLLSRKQGKYSLAKEYYEQALRLCDRIGAKIRKYNYKEWLGSVAIAMEDYELGQQLILEATESVIETSDEKLSVWITPPQVPLLLEHLGNPELAVIALVASINQPLGELSIPEYDEQLEVFRAKYPRAEMSKWVEKAKQIKPFELATAIRDALSEE